MSCTKIYVADTKVQKVAGIVEYLLHILHVLREKSRAGKILKKKPKQIRQAADY